MARRSSAMWLASIERYIDPSMEDIFQTKKEAIVMYSLRKGRVQSVACKACLFVCLFVCIIINDALRFCVLVN